MQRSIPACAGEPSQDSVTATSLTVYPRVCGGTADPGDTGQSSTGLSPRVRGNQQTARAPPPTVRSIPACAGEPPGYTRRYSIGEVYPRVCGGTHTEIFRPVLHPGLSPRVRGNPMPRCTLFSAGGSIPACAGEPFSTFTVRAAPRVYPRVCGGTSCITHYLVSRQGLSPRVRGNPRKGSLARVSRRSIPACAGEPR